MRIIYSLFWLMLVSISGASAQRKLYLDAQVGQWYGHAEEAYLHRSRLPYPIGSNVLDGSFWGGAQARLVLNTRWSATAGVVLGDRVSWGYKLKVPVEATNNPYAGEEKKYHYAAFSIGMPLAIQRSIWQVRSPGVGQQGQVHAWGMRADALIGITPSYLAGELGFPNLNIGGFWDTIRVTQAPAYKQRLGLTLDVGATVRLYRLDKERLSLTLQLHQGLLEMVRVPFDYYYNRRTGSGQLSVYGSGISLSVGYPILLKTFAARAAE